MVTRVAKNLNNQCSFLFKKQTNKQTNIYINIITIIMITPFFCNSPSLLTKQNKASRSFVKFCNCYQKMFFQKDNLTQAHTHTHTFLRSITLSSRFNDNAVFVVGQFESPFEKERKERKMTFQKKTPKLFCLFIFFWFFISKTKRKKMMCAINDLSFAVVFFYLSVLLCVFFSFFLGKQNKTNCPTSLYIIIIVCILKCR
jgi:hypothetical protein